ncbi:S1C family serine protease [Mycolicibacterium diernhoferi]|uniref:Serine protease n=1 Tax=Mycolicibacterium diernhoferi TaxID=1801 RepID=A0A1Q4HB65_9MYCO|nr:S1C family serine protease [Mycolicibacterium diernhoferi]OJZ64789.1 serine protease [Mycolicibacterium diernhoferi]OPE48793.1 serine protease [Mycolicibacterium diernhoferi]PEG51615.1 serine protease [Mycolicibacterium diernhoferi]QYL22530.1 S1C family serine protease [Mycolicibacterium diernhoferi]
MRKVLSWWWLTALFTAFAAVLLVAPATAAADPAALAVAADQVEPSVVRLDTVVDYQHVMGTGTGFVIDGAGQVLTNHHVVQGADVITAVVGGRSFDADILGYDRGRDIAVLQLRGAGGLPVAALGDSTRIAIGDPVIAIGNARGSNSPLTREPGTITALGRTISAEDELTGAKTQMSGLFEIAAPVRSGDSGGPVINAAGQVIGVTTAATINFQTGPGGEGFAIPINEAMAIAGQIRSRTPSDTVHIGPPTLLGVGVSSAEQHSAFPGVLVHEVLRGGPAELAGLANGDVILTIDGTPIESAAGLTQVLDRHYPGDVIELTWVDRAGQHRTGKTTLGAGA